MAREDKDGGWGGVNVLFTDWERWDEFDCSTDHPPSREAATADGKLRLQGYCAFCADPTGSRGERAGGEVDDGGVDGGGVIYHHVSYLWGEGF